MKLNSKIKQIFSNELLELTAAVCDTKKIPSSIQKMKLIGDLLFTHGIKWGFLGGATNRVVMFIDGYAIKFAIDSQGYRDNFIEYSICEEMQPYVTKSYETNGYILVAEYVKLMKEPDFIARKQDILNILMALADDYLLGDVGYIKKNMTNLGIRDNGEVVLLDYAYCHRATERLFTCPTCGEGILAYDHVFDKLVCTNKTVCHSIFTYNDMKSIQGDQVDLDMIEERKKISLVLPEDETYAVVHETGKGRFVDKNGKTIVIVDNDETYQEMLEERRKKEDMLNVRYASEDSFDHLVRLAVASADGDRIAADTIIQDSKHLHVYDYDDEDEVEYEIDPDYESERIAEREDLKHTIRGVPVDDDTDDYDVGDAEDSFSRLIKTAMNYQGYKEDYWEDDDNERGISENFEESFDRNVGDGMDNADEDNSCGGDDSGEYEETSSGIELPPDVVTGITSEKCDPLDYTVTANPDFRRSDNDAYDGTSFDTESSATEFVKEGDRDADIAECATTENEAEADSAIEDNEPLTIELDGVRIV